MYSSSPNVAPWLLLLPRTGHLKCRREKESESWGFLAVMVLMVLAVFFYLSYLGFLKQAKQEGNGPMLA
jgi:4-amino-4-deoxy-L-arabinose transferase-like glycosyltransferase